MSLVILFAIALLPGLVSWWTGRGLLSRRDDPALAERLLTHNRRVIRLAILVLVVVTVGLVFEENKLLAGLIAVVPVFSLLAGGFRLRRTLYEETWSFPTYLSFFSRLYAGVFGFWLVMLTAPFLVTAAGQRGWIAAVVLGLILVLWNHGYPSVLIRLARARPLGDDERFASYFATVDERSSVPAPQRLVVPVPGGRLVNALALPSTRQPRVVFSSSLLDLLEPEEVGAVYAHEVGHLEYFRGRKLRNLGIVVHVMTAMAVLWGLLPWKGQILQGYLWVILFLVLARLRARWMRGHESDTDVRAAELCGDAEAVIRGLTRLHQLMLLPRRLAIETEKAMTHPSLARRLQAIRERAGHHPKGPGEAESAPGSPAADGDQPAPLLVRTGKAGVCLLLGPERFSWFEGVPAELAAGAPAFDLLHRSAAASHTLAYGQLAELRLEIRRTRPALVVVDSEGKKRLFEVANDDVAGLQRWLDAIDARLAKPTAKVASQAARSWHRLLAAAAALSSFLPPVAGAASVPALFALVRPRPASLTAAGLAGLAACGYRALQIPVHSFGRDLTTLSTWILGLLSVLLLAVGIRWSRQVPEERHQTAWPLAATCWVLTAVAWGVLLFMSASGGTLDVFRLSYLLFWAPSAVVLPLSAAVALFFARDRRGGRVAFALASVLTLVPLAAATTAFRDAVAGDPFVPRGPVPATGRRALEEVARSELDFRGAKLRLSPSGETWAISTGWELSEPLSWRLGRVDGSPLPAGSEEKLSGVIDLAFVDDERLVLLRREAAGDGGSEDDKPDAAHLVVRLSLGAGEPRPIRLPLFGEYEARLGVAGESWRVLGFAYHGKRHLMRRLTGRWADDEVVETTWELGDAETEWGRGTAGAGAGALMVRTRFFEGSVDQRRSEILALPLGSQQRPLVSTELGVTCEILPPSDSALCLAHDRARTYLWRVDPAGGEPELLGSYRSPGGEQLLAADEGVLIRPPVGSPYWLEHESGRLFELDMPAESRGQTMAVSETGLVAELRPSRSGQGGSVLTVYRPEL